jgi:hypothetical protein
MKQSMLAALLAPLILLAPARTSAQHAPPTGGHTAPAARARHHDLSTPRPSFEAMSSRVFRTVSAVTPIGHRIVAEVHYFALPEAAPRVNVLQSGLSYQFPLGQRGFVAPGIGFYSGVDHEALSITARWLVEVGPIVSEGLIVQGIDNDDGTERGQFWDGNHVSLALLDRRLEVGPAWEHIHIRDEDEWKGGGRVALRVHPRVLVQAQALAPGETEWRVGVLVR